MQKYNIVIVEDEEEIALLTKRFLEKSGFNVEFFLTATDAMASVKFKAYDLLLLDINLPDYDGFEILKAIKSSINTPVIILSSHSDTKTKLRAFKLGASDYMVKPFDLEELEARIWLALDKKTMIPSDETTFHIEESTILFNNKKLSLTQIEYEILKTLIESKNIIVPREVLSSELSTISSTRSLDYHIKNIRKKIDDNGTNAKYLKTEYGLGYKLAY